MPPSSMKRAVSAGSGDKDQHERRAARHRAGAAADTQRAEHARFLLGDEEARACGPGMDQTSYRLLIDTGHNEGTSLREDAGYDEKC
jgi:hypothetical protein